MSKSSYSNITLNYIVSNFTPRAASLILLPVFLRFMDINIWGEISLLLAFQIVFVNIFSWGLDSLAHRVFQDLDKEVRNQFINRTIKKFFIYNFFFLIILEFVLNTNLTEFFNIDYGIPFRLTVLTGMLISFTRLLVKLYGSLNESVIVRNSIYLESIFIPIFQLSLVSLIIYFYDFEDRMIVSSYFIGQFLGTLIKTIYLKKKSNTLFQTNNKEVLSITEKMQKNYSNLSYLYTMFAMLLGWQDRFFLTKFYTLEEVAKYSTVYRLVDLHGVFISAFVAAVAPIIWSINNKNIKNSKELFRNIISMSTLVGSFGVTASVIIGPILLPPQYHSALAIVPYLAIGFIFGSLASLYGLLLEKEYKLHIRLYGMIGGALTNLVLIYLLIGKYEILGLSYATMFGFIVVFIINYFYTNKEYRILIFNKYFSTSLIVISLFIVLYKDIWYLNLFFLLVSVVLLILIVNLFKQMMKFQNSDFYGVDSNND